MGSCCSLSVWGTQPIWRAADSMAAHSGGNRCGALRPTRTARLLISVENGCDCLRMAPSCQEKASHQNSDRFSLFTHWIKECFADTAAPFKWSESVRPCAVRCGQSRPSLQSWLQHGKYCSAGISSPRSVLEMGSICTFNLCLLLSASVSVCAAIVSRRFPAFPAWAFLSMAVKPFF